MIFAVKGSGKSLIYQLAALVMNKLALVVGPLLSLATDQVERLNRYGIGARLISYEVQTLFSVILSYIHVCFKEQNLDEIKEDIGSEAPRIKFLYITPVNCYNNINLV